MLRIMLLVAAVVGALSGWAGYRLGTGLERGKAATVAESASKLARRNAAREEQRRAAAALRDARADAAGREVALRAQIDALARAPRPGCEWGPDRLRGVNAAVDLYNGTGVPAALPDDAEGTGGR